METENQPRSIVQTHKVNLILIALILFLSSFIVFTIYNKGGQFKTSLIPGGTVVYDIDLSAGTVRDKSVQLIWNDPLSGAQSSYTNEVQISARVYTGEVQTAQLEQMWDLFTEINYNTTLQPVDGTYMVTALGLRPETTYTFAILVNDLPHMVSHLSNAHTVSTLSLEQGGAGGPPGSSVIKGDTNRDGDINQWDAYLVVMYLYFEDWSAFLASMSTQGVSVDLTLTEAQFNDIADVDRNCVTDFSDVSLISSYANGTIEVFPEGTGATCTY